MSGRYPVPHIRQPVEYADYYKFLARFEESNPEVVEALRADKELRYVPRGNKWDEKIRNAIEDGARVEVVIGVSAGKDSTAVALMFREKFPELMGSAHFIFSDTGSELKETYEYLDKLGEALGVPVKHLISRLGTLEEIIKDRYNGFLPSAVSRYCTRVSKIVPLREYMDTLCGDADIVFTLVGIRADEGARSGYEPCGQYAHKVAQLMPLKDENMVLKDVFELVDKEVGLPEYYEWRTRSGCYFCFYQRRIEWVNLKDRHPELFEKAKEFEKLNDEDGKRFTWIKGMSLSELEGKAGAIRERYIKKLGRMKEKGQDLGLTDAILFEKAMNELEPENVNSCSVCR